MTPSPFKFLDSYGKEDAATFFGREAETDELYARCTHAQTLVIYGRSGTGKTSLVQCGLRSRFDESDWLPITIRRGTDLNESLISELRSAALTASNSNDPLELVRNVYLDHFVPVYLLFDQFEELFIFGGEEEQQNAIASIRKLLEERNVRLLFIIREEYLAYFTNFEEQVPGILVHRMRVERMARKRALDVVEKLCAAQSIECAPGFSETMVERLNTEGQGVELSYLQVYLDRCWRSRKDGEPFSVQLLERIGYVDDLLGSFLDEQIAETPDPQRTERLLKAFVSDQGTKRQITASEAHEWVNALGTSIDVDAVDEMLQTLVTRRVLKDRDEQGRYELLHDALARQIFEKFTRAEKEVLEVRQFVENAHLVHQKRGITLSEDDLRYIAPYETSLFLREDLARFIRISRERITAGRRRKRRLLIGSIAGALAAMFLGLGGYILKQDRDARNFEEILKRSSIIASADMMNVLFVGVDNPLTISFPGITCEDLDLVVSDGVEIVRGDKCGSYWVRVRIPQQVSIKATAMVNGKRMEIGSPVFFRVKRLPDPQAGIVQLVGNGQLTVSEIVPVQRLHLKIPNSDFAVDGTIRAFRMVVRSNGRTDVYHAANGDSLSAAMLARVRTLTAGDQVVFDSIFAQLSDDDVRQIQPLVVSVTEGGAFPVSLDGIIGNPVSITTDLLKQCKGFRIERNELGGRKARSIVSYDCEISEIGSIDVVAYHGTSGNLTPEILELFQKKTGLYDIEFKHLQIRCVDGKPAFGQDIWIRLAEKP